MLLFLSDTVYSYLPHIAAVFGLIFVEGLLGGAAYVNTFNRLHSHIPLQLKEYCMSVVTLADTLGIVVAGFTAIPVHNFICSLSSFSQC